MVTQNEEARGFRRSIEYRNTNFDELLEKYPDHWIAVYDGELVGASTDLQALFDKVKTQGIPLRITLVDKMATEDVEWVFPS